MREKFEVSRERLIQLEKDSAKLGLLEAGGVDNWEWYGDSLNPEDEKNYETLCEEIEREYNS